MASQMSYQRSSQLSFQKPSSNRSAGRKQIISSNLVNLNTSKKDTNPNESPPCKSKKCDKKVCEDSQTRIRNSCYPMPKREKAISCPKRFEWQHGTYVRDQCGSGIVPTRANFRTKQKRWCKTPLTMYQSTIGELGRQLLCGETKVTKDVRDGPPCNVCEYVLPLCREYYRKYNCINPCEEELAQTINGRKVYRDSVERYWFPCMTMEERNRHNIRSYAPHNAYLGEKLKRTFHEERNPCW